MNSKKTNAPVDVQGRTQSILDYVGQHESKGDYNALVYGKKGSDVPTSADLTDMTLNQVLNYQTHMIGAGHASTAVGKYQFIKATLKGLIRQSGLDPETTKFDAATQDRFATMLLQEAGLDKYNKGAISPEQFGEGVAKIWASIPLSSGKSAYEGIAGNKAGASYSNFMDVLTGA